MGEKIVLNRMRVSVVLDIDDIAKMRTLMRGKTKEVTIAPRGKVMKAKRPQSIQDFIENAVRSLVKGVKPDLTSIAWADAHRKSNYERIHAGDMNNK